MEQSKPRLSVIMAVYNGERFLRQTMDSIISQTFDSFEVIVIRRRIDRRYGENTVGLLGCGPKDKGCHKRDQSKACKFTQ